MVRSLFVCLNVLFFLSDLAPCLGQASNEGDPTPSPAPQAEAATPNSPDARKQLGIEDGIEVPLWKSGVGRRKITPRQPMWMSGYAGRDRAAEATLTELWAKALLLEDPDGHRALLITLDLIGIDRELSRSICEQLESRHHLQRDQISICCSHTHTGPALKNNLTPMHYAVVAPEQRTLIDNYVQWLRGSILEAVGDAFNALAPCQLSWGTGQASFATNRRENSAAEVRSLRTRAQLSGPIDHSVPVLAVRRADQSLSCIVFGYACHATTLASYGWSGDYPGYAQMEIEQTHPNCVAMFCAGCGADQNPLPRRSIELCRHYGRRLAIAVEAVLLTTQMREIQGPLRTRYDELKLALSAIPERTEIEVDTASSNPFVASRAKLFLDQLDQGQTLEATYPYPICVWRLGEDLYWTMLGGEVVVDYAIRIKTELPKHHWVTAYANDVMAYIPSRRVLREGGYEADSSMIYYGLPGPWAGTVESDIMSKVKAIVRKMSTEDAARD